MQTAPHIDIQHGAHEQGHEDLGFWRTYIFSTDHKVIGIQYGVMALVFLFFGLMQSGMKLLQLR